jgi:hypothetical protein
VLLLAELVGMEVGETIEDGDGSQLGLGREPAFDQRHVRVMASGSVSCNVAWAAGASHAARHVRDHCQAAGRMQ